MPQEHTHFQNGNTNFTCKRMSRYNSAIFTNYFLSFAFTFKKNLMVAAPSSMVDTPERNRFLSRKKSSLWYVSLFVGCVLVDARIFFRSRPNNIFFSLPPKKYFFLLPRLRSRRNIFFPPFCPRASIRRPRLFFFLARGTSVPVARHGGPRSPSFHASNFARTHARTHSAQIVYRIV